MSGDSDAEIAVGDVVQIDPAHDAVFGACFMVVSELKPTWNGLQGYVQIPGPEGGLAYYRGAHRQGRSHRPGRVGCTVESFDLPMHRW